MQVITSYCYQMVLNVFGVIFVWAYLLCFVYAIAYFPIGFVLAVISKGRINLLGNKVAPPIIVIGEKPQIKARDTVKLWLFNAWVACVALAVIGVVLFGASQQDSSCVDSSRFVETFACDFLPDNPLP
jgi:hypothetical protein